MPDATLTVRLLGPPQILVDRAPLRVDTRKAVAILAYLVATEQPQARTHLAALLWPEADDASARGALRRTLSTLKAALGDRWLVVDRSSVRLEREGAWADVWQLRAASDSSVDRAVAEAVLRGEFMAGFGLRDAPDFDDWVAAQAEAWRQRSMSVLDGLVRESAERGELAAAIEVAERRLALDPLDEAAHRTLMELYAHAGDRSAALRQYRALVRRLARELDVEPLPETTDLYESILAGEAPSRPAPSGEEPPVRRGPLPLVGRAPQLERLSDAWGRRAGGVVLIEGEPGIGKTRLAEELLARVTRDGGRSLVVRGYAGGRDTPYAPLVDALERLAAEHPERLAVVDRLQLQEASRIVPRLGGAPEPPAPDDQPGGQARLITAMAQVLAVAAGDVLLVEDAQELDASTLTVIAHLARTASERPMVVITRRPVPSADDLLLPGLAAARRSGGMLEVRPTRLEVGDVRELVERTGTDADPSALHAESEGVPFYIAERLAALRAGGEEAGIPAGVRDLVRTRVAACSEVARQVLDAAAVIGAGFDPGLVRAVSGRSEEEVARAIDELEAAGLLVGDEPGALRIDHELTRQVLLDDLGLGRGRALHRRAAAALRRGQAARTAPARVAEHLRAAGEGRAAADWYRRAGLRAAEVHAHLEAIGHFRTALALSPEQWPELHELIAERFMRLGRYSEAAAAYEAAAGSLPAGEAWRAELGLARAHRRLGHLALAEAHAEAAELGVAEGSDADRATALMERARIADRRGNLDEAAAGADRALALLDGGPALALADAHNLAGLVARHRRDAVAARAHLTGALRLASATRSPSARMAALNNLALLEADEGNVDAAEARLRQSLALAVQIGNRHHEAALRSNLADVLNAAGRRREAVAEVAASAAIMAELGGIASDGADALPEVWRLTDW